MAPKQNATHHLPTMLLGECAFCGDTSGKGKNKSLELTVLLNQRYQGFPVSWESNPTEYRYEIFLSK